MKFWKKAFSALLAAVTAVTMMFAGSVTAGAATKKTETSPYYVTYKESSDELILTIYGFSEEDYKFLTDSDFPSMGEYESKYATIKIVFDDIYFKDNLEWEYFENGRLYDYSEGNYHSVHFDSSRRYEVSLSSRSSTSSVNFDEFHGEISELREYDASPDSYYYGRTYSWAVDSFSGKSKWIDLGTSSKYRYAFQFVLGKNQLPTSITNHILRSISCKAHAGRFVWSFGGGEKGGGGARVTSILGEGSYDDRIEHAVLPFAEDEALPSKTTTQKDISFQIVSKKTTLTAKRSGEKITLSWDAVKGAEKYQIYYREKGESKYKKLATVSGTKTSYSTSKLDKNKTYQFKIRSYAESNGKKVYSKFSKVKTVTAK